MYFLLIKTFILCSEVPWMPHCTVNLLKYWYDWVVFVLEYHVWWFCCKCQKWLIVAVLFAIIFKENFQDHYTFQILFMIFICITVQRNRTERNTGAEKRRQLYGPVVFVAKRMLKWQICKFVSEESLVFIFISQSGFLLAEQQARKRLILTT